MVYHREKKWYETEGSYTVEAVFIIPILFFLLFTVIRYSFLLHDRMMADVWAAHTAEEARMAMQYGRVPYDDSISTEGFDGELRRKALIAVLEAREGELAKWCMQEGVYGIDVDISKKEVSASAGIRAETKYGILYEKTFSSAVITRKRSVEDPVRNLRLTTLIFRSGKKILNV